MLEITSISIILLADLPVLPTYVFILPSISSDLISLMNLMTHRGRSWISVTCISLMTTSLDYLTLCVLNRRKSNLGRRPVRALQEKVLAPPQLSGKSI